MLDGTMSTDDLDTHPGTQQRTTFLSFLVTVAAVLGLGCFGLYLYKGYVTTKAVIHEKSREAILLLKKNDYRSLKKAEALLTEILGHKVDHAETLARMAATQFYLASHGDPALQKARDFLVRAEAADTNSPTKHAVTAFLNIVDGNPQKAESDLKALLDQGVAAPIIAHAYGWAILEQDREEDAARILRQAKESDFSAIALRLRLAEIAERQGDGRRAVRLLEDATFANMNPNHMLGKATLAALSLRYRGSLVRPAKLIEELERAQKNNVLGPRTVMMLSWAKAELLFATGDLNTALQKVAALLETEKHSPRLLELKARILFAQKKSAEAISAYQSAMEARPRYRSIAWALARAYSERGDSKALVLAREADKQTNGKTSARYEIFQGEHALKQGDLEGAEAAFKRAANQSRDPAILFGLAKITFLKEKKKGRRANIDQVSKAFATTLSKRRNYPEVHEFIAGINLWNYMVDGANNEFAQAESQYKRLSYSVPKMLDFYDRVIDALGSKTSGPARSKARSLAKVWETKKKQYLASLFQS